MYVCSFLTTTRSVRNYNFLKIKDLEWSGHNFSNWRHWLLSYGSVEQSIVINVADIEKSKVRVGVGVGVELYGQYVG